MLAIPKKSLCHNISVQAITGEDSWGTVSKSDIVQIEFVRIEPSDKIKISKEGRQITLSALLFYDSVNSKPKDYVFSTEDIVTWNDSRYKIASIEPIYGINKLHHLEIGLVAFYG
ncbi:MAG: putative minor capsid protein [Clostridia bacterium]